MHQVTLAVSYDTEQAVPADLPKYVILPDKYSQLSKAEKQKLWTDYLRAGIWDDPEHLSRSVQELETIKELGDLFAGYDGKLTSFILGKWLDFVVEGLGQAVVRDAFSQETIDIQSHSYHHKTYQSTGDKLRGKMSPALQLSEINEELSRANNTISQHLNVVPIGLRTPMGNLQPFRSDDKEILTAFQKNGIQFVSSWLKKLN